MQTRKNPEKSSLLAAVSTYRAFLINLGCLQQGTLTATIVVALAFLKQVLFKVISSCMASVLLRMIHLIGLLRIMMVWKVLLITTEVEVQW